MAAAFFGGPGGGRKGLEVTSAGLLSGGRTPPPEVFAVMDPYGLDLRAHQSRQLDAELVGDADLVLGMARRHVQETVLLDGDSWARSFTLKEFVRRAGDTGPRDDGLAVRNWAATIHDGRSRAELVGRDDRDEVADPYGGPLEGYQQTAEELADLVRQLAGLLRPSAPEARSRPIPVPELDDSGRSGGRTVRRR